jgi:hypothetical protein
LCRFTNAAIATTNTSITTTNTTTTTIDYFIFVK